MRRYRSRRPMRGRRRRSYGRRRGSAGRRRRSGAKLFRGRQRVGFRL